MKLHDAISIGSQKYAAGADIPWYKVYPFFLVHMLIHFLTRICGSNGKNSPRRHGNTEMKKEEVLSNLRVTGH